MSEENDERIRKGRPLTAEELQYVEQVLKPRYQRRQLKPRLKKQLEEFVESSEKDWIVRFPEPPFSAWKVYRCLYDHLWKLRLTNKIKISVAKCKTVTVHKL
jgi:hypothetical protein